MSSMENVRTEVTVHADALPVEALRESHRHLQAAAGLLAAAGLKIEALDSVRQHLDSAVQHTLQGNAYLRRYLDQIAPGTTPLFDTLDNQGDPRLAEHEKLENIFDVGALLTRLNVPAGLVDEISRLAQTLRPLNALTLGRKPLEAERAELEGRGAYHTVPVGDRWVTVYVKGIGNETTFDKQPGVFTGFPGHADDLFFDDIGNRHPRMTGTETVRWGMLEAYNAATLFADIVTMYGFQTLDEVLDAGVTIPLNVLFAKELSAYAGSHLDEIRAKGLEGLEEENLNWPGNDHLCTVSMIVPGRRRISRQPGQRDPQTAANIADPQIAATAGRTLRIMIQQGRGYSPLSAHGQNLYTEGLVAQADNSDFVFFGDYHGGRTDDQDAEGNTVYRYNTAYDQRRALLIGMLSRDAHMRPAGRPLAEEAHGVSLSWEDAVASSRAFWRELLQGVADPAAIDRLVWYIPIMRTEFDVAAASLLMQHNSPEWDQKARVNREILAAEEEGYGVLTEYEKEVQGDLHKDASEQWVVQGLEASGRLLSRPLERFLATGDEGELLAHPKLRHAMELVDTIVSIPESNIRDTLLSLCHEALGAKDLIDLANHPDMASSFNSRHYELLQHLLRQGRYTEADHCMRALIITGRAGDWAGAATSDLTGERNRDKYRRMLLDPGLSPTEVFEQSQFDKILLPVSREASVGGMTLGEALALQHKGLKPPPGVSSIAKSMGYPAVKEVATQIFNELSKDPRDRAAIMAWIEHYGEKMTGMYAVRNHPARRAALLDEMDALAAEVAGTYPELELIHTSYAAGRAAAIDPERAQSYLTKGVEYYFTQLPRRSQLCQRPTSEWIEPYLTAHDPVKMERLALMYEQQGFTDMAAYYRAAIHNVLL